MRFGRFNQAAKNMISDLFQAEAEADLLEAETTTLSVKCNVSTAAMLTVLSELFSQSRYAFTGEILEDFTADLFLNLPDDKRAEIAVKADLIETELLAKKGITVKSVGASGSTEGSQTWQTMNSSKDYLKKFYPEGAQ
jgi:hypothetical protein